MQKIIFMNQVHGTNVVVMNNTNITADTNEQGIADADGLVTSNPNVALAAYGADCCMIAFWDQEKVGICHLGWRGLVDGMIDQMFKHFDPRTCRYHIGPFLHSFEIQKDECYSRIEAKYGEKYFRQSAGKIIFNFREAVFNSVSKARGSIDVRSTEENYPDLASWRGSKGKKGTTQNKLFVWRDDSGNVEYKFFKPSQKVLLPVH